MNDQCWRTKAHCSFLYSAQLSRVILTLEFPPYWISTFPSAQTDWRFPSTLESSQPFLFLSIFLFCFVNFFPLWKSIISDCTMVIMYMTVFLLFSFTFFSTKIIIGSQYLPRHPYFYFPKDYSPKIMCSP